jgi:ATP-binding cassette subfamily B protein
MNTKRDSNAAIIRRLITLSWRYRVGCVKVLVFQVLVLAIGMSTLGLTGLGIDVIRHAVHPVAGPPQWPFGIAPAAGWTALTVVAAIAGAIFVLSGVRAVCTFLYTVSLASVVEREMILHLRAQVYEKLQRLSFRFFDANATGTIINRVTGDSRAVANFLNEVLIKTIIMVLSLAVYLAYMLTISWRLTLATLATTPLLWLATRTFSRAVRPAYQRNRDLFDYLVLLLSESVQGIAVIKGFAREPEEIAKFRAANAAVHDQQRWIFWRVSMFVPAIGFLTQINIVILLAYGGWLVIHSQLPLGTGMIVFAGLLQQFSGQVANLGNIANVAQQSLTGARRVFEVLDTPVEIHSSSDAVRADRLRGAVRFDTVSFAYKQGEPILTGINLAVEAGQCVAILGATGAGKSTLLSLIPRFYDATAGTVRVDGHDVRTLDIDDLRRNIGVVFQESFLFSNTVAANIAFGHPEATREQIERAARIAAAHEFITALPDGYDTVLGEYGATLSGGQRQRLAIARALLLEPPILLLDDPTAAIDPETEEEILEAMDRAMAGRTTFVVAHRLSTLRRADLVVVMEAGRIVQRGTHRELMGRTGHYLRAAKLQLADDESLRLLGVGAGHAGVELP